MSKQIKIVVIRPGEAPRQETIHNSLAELQKIVGGPIEVVMFTIGRKRFHFYVDEEATIKLKMPPANFVLGPNIIFGPALVSRVDSEGEEIGLTEPETSEVMDYVRTLRRL